MSIMIPKENRTTHIIEAQPKIGVPTVHFSTITLIIRITDRTKNRTPIVDMQRIGK